MGFTLKKLAEIVDGKILGDGDKQIVSAATLKDAGADQITFLANDAYLPQVLQTRAAAVVINVSHLPKIKSLSKSLGTKSNAELSGLLTDHSIHSDEIKLSTSFILTKNPYVSFARIVNYISDCFSKPTPYVDLHAAIAKDADIACSASIGPFVTIEAGAIIGKRVVISAHSFIGRNVIIQDDSYLYPNVTVYHGCKIGHRAILHSGVVIGSDGFGFAPDFSKNTELTNETPTVSEKWVKIPQIGSVEIGDDVEIGANTTIDRGALSNTIIEDDVKIDNLVQIAHNCRIGAHTVIAACVGIAGSTTIGQHCMLGGAAGIAGHITLGDRVIITAKSGVSKSLLKPGIYTSAFPAMSHKEWNRNAAIMRNLDKMRAELRQVEKRLHEISLIISIPSDR